MKMKKEKLITIIALSCAGFITAASIPLSAYVSYSGYLNGIIGNKGSSNSGNNDSKGENSSIDGTTDGEMQLVSIEAKLKEGISYFDNKKAKPIADDFTVTAHYTKGGTNVDEEIYSDQFEMEVPEDFALTGGTIKFSFEGKETNLELSLTPIKLTSIKIIGDPYKTYYKEGEVFDKTGITISGLNNDKSEVALTDGDIEGLNTPLAIGQTTAEIHLKSDASVKGEIAIKVVSANDFNEGRLLSIEVVSGKALLKAGASIDEVDISSLEILRKYECGNKYLSKADNLEVATTDYVGATGDNKVITVKVKDTLITTDVPLYIENKCDFLDASALKGVTVNSEETYVLDEQGKAVSNGKANVIRFAIDPNDASDKMISINFKSNSYSAGSLFLRVSNNDATLTDGEYVANELKLNELFELKVNGHRKFINASAMTSAVKNENKDIAGKTYSDVLIKDLNLLEGGNSITLSVRKNAKASKVSVADFVFLSDGATPNYGFLDYLEVVGDGNVEANYTCITKDAISDNNFKNTYSVIEDDDYYYALQSESWNGKKLIISKVDKTQNTIEEKSEVIEYTDGAARYHESFDIFFNDEGNICYWDSITNVAKIYNKDTLKLTDNTFTFSGVSGGTQLKASYNEENETYAAMVYGNLQLFDKNGKKLDCTLNSKNINVDWTYINENESRKFGLAGIAAYGDYIVVNSRSKGNGYGDNPLHQIRVYDYDGNCIYTTNDQVLAEEGNEYKGYAVNYLFNETGCYLITNNWQAGFNILKVSANAVFAKKFDTSVLGGYVEKAKFEEKQTNYSTTILNQDNPIKPKEGFKTIDSTINVGDQIFASYSNNGSTKAVISKLDLDNKTILQTSDEITLGEKSIWKKSNTLFSKDGYIGMVNNRDYSIAFFDSKTLKRVDKGVITFTGLPEGTKISYVTYNDLNKKFALADKNNNLYFADEFGRMIETVGPLNKPTNAFKTAQLNCDNGYIYMIYACDGDYNAWLNIYDWNGNFIKDEKIVLSDKVDAEGTNKQINIQAMVNYNNKLYISVLAWGGGFQGQFLYEVTFDQTIFN